MSTSHPSSFSTTAFAGTTSHLHLPSTLRALLLSAMLPLKRMTSVAELGVGGLSSRPTLSLPLPRRPEGVSADRADAVRSAKVEEKSAYGAAEDSRRRPASSRSADIVLKLFLVVLVVCRRSTSDEIVFWLDMQGYRENRRASLARALCSLAKVCERLRCS